jgi:predicted amidohydrolase
MLVAVAQLGSQDDPTANLARAVALVREAKKGGASLVALPENFAYMGEEATKRSLAERLDDGPRGPIASALAEAAAREGIHIVAGGMPEASGDPDRPYNTSVFFTKEGRIGATYRKVHLFDVSLADGTELKESNATKAGEGVQVVDVDGVPLGMSVCYDLRFPELYRALTDKGARIVTVPAAFTLTTGKDHWHVLLRARAIENQVYVLAPAQHGRHPRNRQTYGKSVIIDPWGDVLAQAREGEGLAFAHLDFAYQDRVRAQLPCLAHRRMG